MWLRGTTYSGLRPNNPITYGTIASAFSETPPYTDCEYKEKWSGWLCTDQDIG